MNEAQRLTDLEARVSVLEEQLAGTTPHRAPAAEQDREGTFWALEGLRARIPDPGAVMIVGSVQTPKGYEARWQVGATTDDLFSSDFADRAEGLSALAHPTRLRIVQRLLTDAQTVQDLAATEAFGTTGQVYHHLRQLTAAGWLRASGGGKYEVPVDRVVPLLTMLVGVDR